MMLYSFAAASAIATVACVRRIVAWAGATSSSSVLPTWIRSPCRTTSRSTSSEPLTKVPLAEPRSSTNARPSSTCSWRWRRETWLSSSTKSDARIASDHDRAGDLEECAGIGSLDHKQPDSRHPPSLNRGIACAKERR